MLISRGLALTKTLSGFAVRRATPNKIQVRNSGGGVSYRDIVEPPRIETWTAEITSGIMWWWVFWHMWHDWGHIVGEFPYPEASEWTDAELGIPPDDVDV